MGMLSKVSFTSSKTVYWLIVWSIPPYFIYSPSKTKPCYVAHSKNQAMCKLNPKLYSVYPTVNSTGVELWWKRYVQTATPETTATARAAAAETLTQQATATTATATAKQTQQQKSTASVAWVTATQQEQQWKQRKYILLFLLVPICQSINDAWSAYVFLQVLLHQLVPGVYYLMLHMCCYSAMCWKKGVIVVNVIVELSLLLLLLYCCNSCFCCCCCHCCQYSIATVAPI